MTTLPETSTDPAAELVAQAAALVDQWRALAAAVGVRAATTADSTTYAVLGYLEEAATLETDVLSTLGHVADRTADGVGALPEAADEVSVLLTAAGKAASESAMCLGVAREIWGRPLGYDGTE